jgi:hypothetical protein
MRALACCALVATIANVAIASTIPRDFELKAKFFPGAGFAPGGPEPWHVTISADGKAIVETYTYEGDKEQKHLKSRQLSQADLVQIVTAFQKASFFTLPERMIKPFGEPGHQMGIGLKLTSNGKSHFVVFSVPGTIRNRAAAKRFWQAWSVVATKVPSPNRNREFNYWLHYNPL